MPYQPIPGQPDPTAPPFPTNPQGPYGPQLPYRPPLMVKTKQVGAPLAVLIILGIIGGIMVALFTASKPSQSSLAIVLASIAAVVVIGCYLWLDRWEPEAPRLLILAFLWGAVVATSGALVVGVLFDALGLLSGETSGTTVQAPLVEELLKGAFLLIMLTGRRRAEMNSLTDCLVYAGLCGAGFAWLENILYIGQSGSPEGAALTAGLRLILGPFAHPLFTSMTAIGVFYGLRQRSGMARAGCIVVGLVGAMLLHGLWNASPRWLNGLGYFVVYLLVMIPVFVIMIIVAVKSRRGEQQMAAAKLPGMVQAGLVRPHEVDWLQDIKARKAVVAEAARIGGRQAATAVKRFADAVIELSFVRDRIDRGLGNPQVFSQQEETAQAVVFARQQAPVLQQLEQLRTVPAGMPGGRMPGGGMPGGGMPGGGMPGGMAPGMFPQQQQQPPGWPVGTAPVRGFGPAGITGWQQPGQQDAPPRPGAG